MRYFLKLTLPQYFFVLSLLQQAFTRKSKNPCRFKDFQEYPRLYKHLGFSWNFLNLHGLLDFQIQAVGLPWIFKNILAHKSWEFLEIPSSIFLQAVTVKPIFHCNVNLLALGAHVGLDPQSWSFDPQDAPPPTPYTHAGSAPAVCPFSPSNS